tara:strand:+ start:422 stop:634 length:213 start_codon:yes stop_codon:yes gene_type:complete
MLKINRPVGMGDGHLPIEEKEVCGLPCVLFYVKKFVKKFEEKIISSKDLETHDIFARVFVLANAHPRKRS